MKMKNSKNRREEQKNDDSVEYLEPEDFKPGGKYYASDKNVNSKTDCNMQRGKI